MTKAHFAWVCIMLLYLSMVLGATGIGTLWDIGHYDGIITYNEINLVPFTDILGFSQVLNIMMFMPLGFLLPLCWKEFRSPVKVLLAGACYSAGIEFCQMFNNRVTDIDDLLMNTLGAVLGYVAWIAFALLFHPKGGKKEVSLSKREVSAYLALSILGQFFLYNWRWVVRIFYS